MLNVNIAGTIFPPIQLVGSADESSQGVYETIPDGTLLIPSTMLPDGETTPETEQHSPRFVAAEIETEKVSGYSYPVHVVFYTPV